MNSRRLLVLLLVAIAAIVGAMWLAGQRNAPRSGAAQGKVLPALSGALNSVNEVRVVTAGGKSAVSLKRDEKFWRVRERDGYPADAPKLRKLLIDLAGMTVVEEKTSSPDNYARLGVEDLAAPAAGGVRIDLLGLDKPASLIVGKSAAGSSAYVRVAGTATSLQAKPQISVEREPRNWLDRTIIDVPADRVQQIRVHVAGAKPYEVTRQKREQGDFTVPNLPSGKALTSPSAANPIAGALGGLTLDDVRRAKADEDWKSDVRRTEYRLFDGTTITISGRKEGEKHLVRIAVGFDEAQHHRFVATPGDKPAARPEEVRSAARSSGARVEGWIYEVPAYKFETLFQPLDDLLSKS